jgi:hypothetical protein
MGLGCRGYGVNESPRYEERREKRRDLISVSHNRIVYGIQATWGQGRGEREERGKGGLTVKLFPSYFQGVLDDSHSGVL